jgi:hypothetical protein
MTRPKTGDNQMVGDPAIATTSLPNRWMGFPHCDAIEASAVQMQQCGHRVDTNLAVLRHDTQNDNDTKRAANGVPGHDERGRARPRPSCPELIPCPAQWTVTKPAHLFGRGTAMTGSLDRSPLASRPTPQVPHRMLSTVCPRLGGRALVFAPCERLGDPAREAKDAIKLLPQKAPL